MKGEGPVVRQEQDNDTDDIHYSEVFREDDGGYECGSGNQGTHDRYGQDGGPFFITQMILHGGIAHDDHHIDHEEKENRYDKI